MRHLTREERMTIRSNKLLLGFDAREMWLDVAALPQVKRSSRARIYLSADLSTTFLASVATTLSKRMPYKRSKLCCLATYLEAAPQDKWEASKDCWEAY